MPDKTYHHGNLREELIEKGIELLNAEGYANLSLRKVAKACGVSHAAPYNHFKDKDELLLAMQQHVEATFMHEMQSAAQMSPAGGHDLLDNLGRAYVQFFVRNPQYFRFVLNLDNVNIVISAANGISGNYGPFNLFKDSAIEVLNLGGVPKAQQADYIAAMWAAVHGVAAMAAMTGVAYDGDWMELTEKILNNEFWGGEKKCKW